jgi:folate-binding protein YgfZ
MTLQEGYRAIREGAVVGAVAARVQIAAAGQDRAAYLQGLLTNDIQGLTPGSGCYSAWLTPQGRMLTDLHVLASDAMILLDVPSSVLQATLQRLDQFIFSEDVRIESLAETLHGVWVHGPGAAGVLERSLEGARRLSEWPEYHHARLPFGEHPVSVARISQIGVPGYCVYLERSLRPAFLSALTRAGAAEAPVEAIEAARIEAGYPVFGVDMTEETIPLEAGIEHRAISFTKGCYVGQEVIIRVLHRGHGRVAKRLVRLQVRGGGAAPGAAVLSGDREIGVVTSAAESPASGHLALGYVHRDHAASGSAVDVAIPGGRAAAVVESLLPTAV